MARERKETDAGGAGAQGFWRHDAAGPARYVSGPDDHGPAGRDVSVTPLNPAQRQGRDTPRAVAGKALSRAVRQGLDPVEDQINRTLTSP